LGKKNLQLLQLSTIIQVFPSTTIPDAAEIDASSNRPRNQESRHPGHVVRGHHTKII
jgi:hypothetical protein